MADIKKFKRQEFTNMLMNRVNVRGSANTVLAAILRQMSFDGPTSRITKVRIYEETRLTRKTILRALGELKIKGIITVIDNWQGGRSKAPTYQLHIPKDAQDSAPGEAKTGKDSMTSEARAKFADEAMIKAGFRPRKHHG